MAARVRKIPRRSVHSAEHDGDDIRPAGFHGGGDHVEPGFVFCAGEGVEGVEVVEVREIGQVGWEGGRGAVEVPEVEGGVGRDGGEVQVGGDG